MLVCLFWAEAQAQKIPTVIPSQLPKNALTAGIPKLPAKPEIPYLEEHRQIQSLKKSYDSLRKELIDLKKITADSTQRDSLFTLAKDRSKKVLEQESKTLENLIENQDIPGEEIKNPAKTTLERVNESKASIEGIKDVDELASLVDLNNENLKALTNEWLMPKVEEQLTGMVKEGFDPKNTKLPNFYGKDALAELTKKGLPSEIPFDQAKEQATGNAKHISNEYLEKLEGNFSKLQLDSMGNVQVLLASEKRKFKLLEPNTLKGAGLPERIGLLLWYDPLTSFGEGIFVESGLSYGFTHQLRGFGAWTVKRSFGEIKEPLREGQGLKVGMRFSKSYWGVQTSLSRKLLRIEFPAGFESRNFSGHQWAGELALVRTISMGESLRSVVMASWDPLFSKDKSLAKSAVQLKIGFELSRLKRLKKDLKPELDQLELDKKIPHRLGGDPYIELL